MAKSKQQSEVEKVLENPESLRDRLMNTEDFFVKNRNIFLGILGAIVIGVGGYLFYNYSQGQKNENAQKEMYAAVLYFEADSLNKALQGDLKSPGLLTIADEYAGTKAGKLANFYIGAIYLKTGKYEDAIKFLKEFSSDDLLVQARAYALIGDANMELNKLDDALEYYKKAAAYKPNAQFTPQYLMKVALANELKNDMEAAIANYDQIINEYPKAQQFNDAKKYKAKAVSALQVK